MMWIWTCLSSVVAATPLTELDRTRRALAVSRADIPTYVSLPWGRKLCFNLKKIYVDRDYLGRTMSHIFEKWPIEFGKKLEFTL
jgi:hypothetical protein